MVSLEHAGCIPTQDLCGSASRAKPCDCSLANWWDGESDHARPLPGGATYFTGGNEILALSAGYLGSLFWGAVMFLAANQPRIRKDWVNSTIGLAVILLTIFFVRSGFGVVFGIFFGAVMITVSRGIGELWNKRVLLALGLTSALYAILDIKDDILDRPEIQSDAHMLAEATGIGTATMWGMLWISIAIFVSARLMMRAFEEA